MLASPQGYPAEDPITRLALNAATKARTTTGMPLRARCARLADLYVQAGVLGSQANETNGRIMAGRSKEDAGVAYLDAGCPAGTLLVLSMALREHERDERDKARAAARP